MTDSGYFSKVGSTGFANGFEVECERKESGDSHSLGVLPSIKRRKHPFMIKTL